ncbi:hypothetical protein [Flexivirga lutea]
MNDTTGRAPDEQTDEPAPDGPNAAGDAGRERQVSEIRNLRVPDNERGLQIDEGIPPEEAARQEEDGPPDESEGTAVTSTSLRDDV